MAVCAGLLLTRRALSVLGSESARRLPAWLAVQPPGHFGLGLSSGAPDTRLPTVLSGPPLGLDWGIHSAQFWGRWSLADFSHFSFGNTLKSFRQRPQVWGKRSATGLGSCFGLVLV